MGITGLLPFLSGAIRQTHLSEFKHQTVAVDGFCWLHKGAIGCATELVQKKKTDFYVVYCMKLVNLLLANKIKPILVFDGQRLPAKSETDGKRRQTKNRARQAGIELLALGRVGEAHGQFKCAIDVTPEMVLNFIIACRAVGVDCIVAPYEADAQLAFLNQNGIADAVITEDSDLAVFGCDKIIYKLESSGQLDVYEKSKLEGCMKMRRFTFEKFRRICILSGCDYLPSLPGIGLKTALKFFQITEETDPLKFLDKIPSYLSKSNLVVTEEYKRNFIDAENTFLYQIVFNPIQRKLQTLMQLDGQPEVCKQAGVLFNTALAYELALGNLNPSTMDVIYNWKPDKVADSSIWAVKYVPGVKRAVLSPRKPQKAKIVDLDTAIVAINKEDVSFEEELNLYKEVEPEAVADGSGVDADDTLTSESSLPAAKRKNPFIRKRMSKWRFSDKSDGENLLKSRFFASASSDTDESISSLSSLSDSVGSKIEVDVHLDLLTPEVDVEENEREVVIPDYIPEKVNSTLQSVENKILYIVPKKVVNNNVCSKSLENNLKRKSSTDLKMVSTKKQIKIDEFFKRCMSMPKK